MCISRATVSAVSCLVVPAFICIDLLISLVLKINDNDDDDDDDIANKDSIVSTNCISTIWLLNFLSHILFNTHKLNKSLFKDKFLLCNAVI